MNTNVSVKDFGRIATDARSRTLFIKKTYFHLALAILVFIGIEAALMHWQPAVELASKMVSSNTSWLIVLAAFMGVSWIANSWAFSAVSVGKQLAGLYLYVIAEAVIFLPLLLLAEAVAPDAIPNAGILTLALTAGLTFTVLFTKQNFSFLGSFLMIGSFVALGLIICSMIFGFQLGMWFAGAMIFFAAACILYQTSAILYTYNDNQSIAAALGLFASVALLFWYILMFMLSRRR